MPKRKNRTTKGRRLTQWLELLGPIIFLHIHMGPYKPDIMLNM